MRIVHLADSHLGMSAFHRLDPETGMNLREKQVYRHFLEGIDRIIALRPDAVVHAGDIFHSVKPKTMAYTTALEALTRLGDHDIPFLVIAGNHDMAKSRYTISPFEVLDYHAAPLHAVYRYRYEPVDLGDARFHLIPNLLQADQYREEFDRIEPLRKGRNVLVTHGLASTLRDYRLNEVMEHEIDATMLSPEFDYIALGHFHGRRQVADRAWYCGSQEFISYGEIRDGKGALVADLDHHTVEPLELPSTPMVDLGEVECSDLSLRQVEEEITCRVDGIRFGEEPPMAMVTLTGVDRKTHQAVDQGFLRDARERLLDLKINKKVAGGGTPLTERHDLREVNYVDLFGEYLQGQQLPERQHRYVREKGSAVIRQVMAGEGEGNVPR
ncbi:MAG: metallophosphoesterase [Methanomicrobiales archaeon]|nr:metallophosphoesterase [Methanomicrobiales archaeon]